MAPFRESWKLLEGRFEELVDFAGGLATIIPGTATVESDFSVIHWLGEGHLQKCPDRLFTRMLAARKTI
jgi:hypothetical protein